MLKDSPKQAVEEPLKGASRRQRPRRPRRPPRRRGGQGRRRGRCPRLANFFIAADIQSVWHLGVCRGLLLCVFFKDIRNTKPQSSDKNSNYDKGKIPTPSLHRAPTLPTIPAQPVRSSATELLSLHQRWG